MKKTLLLVLLVLSMTLTLASCGGKTESPSVDETKKQQTETDEPTPETKDPYAGFKPEDYEFIKVFEAPEGDYRQIAKDYMLKMANFKWIAGEDFSITWKDPGDFKVNLNFKKGQTYYGLPYSEMRSSFDLFDLYYDDGGTFTYDTYYYEEIIGNHCSSSMTLAYQQLVDFPYLSLNQEGLTKLAGNLEAPAAKWKSKEVMDLNGQEKVFEAFAQCDAGDLLVKFIDGSGHSRMISKVELVKSVTGAVNYSRSKIYCIEQTNTFDKSGNGRQSTWWIDHAYTFKELWDTEFVPMTLEIYHTKEELDNAVITFDAKNTPETILRTIKGTVTSNFPLNYVTATIEDENGNVVGKIYESKFGKQYKLALRSRYEDLNIDKLQPGTYKFTLRAGIARGGCEIESFEFTK